MVEIFNEFLRNILTNENHRERLGICLCLDDFIRLTVNNGSLSDFSSCFLLNNDLVKLLESILLMVTNFDINESSELDDSNYTRIDKLILIQTFVQRITYNMKNHIDKSNFKLIILLTISSI